MQYSLMEKITDWIFKNRHDFGITNNTINHFRDYIYDDTGNYRIGGEQVSEFIREFIMVMMKGARNE